MRISIAQFEDQAKKLTAIEVRLRETQLIFNPEVKHLLKTANSTFSEMIFESVINRLELILESYETECRRKPDEFRPYGPEQLLSQGDLCLLYQINNVPFQIDLNKLLTGLLVVGPQGSGKSRLIRHLCKEFKRVKKAIKITLVDPKNAFSNLSDFRHLDLNKISLDLTAPSNANQNNFVYEFMPILANICSLIYGLDFLNQAVDIAWSMLQQYTNQTGQETMLCLRDIFEALLTIHVKNFRQVGYHDAAATSLSIVVGKQNLFSCRKGLSLEWLFSENTVINARCLTNETQCKTLINYFLYWLYQRAKNSHESNEIKQIIIVDDATRFIGIEHQYDAHRRTSPLGHILATLRATGTCVIFATQIPSQIDPAVLSLCRNMIIIGNINGEENLRVIQSFMSLTPEQKNAILRFQTRETLAFISGSSWPYPIHGWASFVEDMPFVSPQDEDYSKMIVPWHSLKDIPHNATESATPPIVQDKPSYPKTKSIVDKLILDAIHYPSEKARDHAKKMSSFREYESAKTEAVQNSFLIASKCGKSLYLIPTQSAFDKFGIVNPYRRASSVEHAFYVQLAADTLKKQSGLTIQIETPIGNKGQTIDLTTVDKSGNLTAYEITLSTSNLSSNASKLQGSAYQKIVWLCRDAGTAKAVRGYFNKCQSLPPELISKFEYEFFGKWIKKMSKGGK